jgi:hypothetical protein
MAKEEDRSWLIAECVRCGLHGSVADPNGVEQDRKRPFTVEESRITQHPESVSPRTYWLTSYREWWLRLYPTPAGGGSSEMSF